MWTMLGWPNILTMLRIGMIPIFILIFYLPFAWAHYVAAVIFAVACLTDWLDGFLARKLHQLSSFGAFFDPVADKLLVASSLILLVAAPNLQLITLPAVVIVGREIVVSALREWMAAIGQRTSVAVSYVGKVKTAMQMVAITLLIACQQSMSWCGILGTALLYLAAILTIWSMVEYLKIAWPELMRVPAEEGPKKSEDSLDS
ncbi:MAG: CDP-diacylglycerol--glycerol-3-phosphate 3-phosphatidyltransferase [Gammaproteobacteria bacterium]|nr:CDP-diacylglycerol--glycerol-3-phosphate 3-phosphatidyltransferase [Gammaproteobacteria bacterium]